MLDKILSLHSLAHSVTKIIFNFFGHMCYVTLLHHCSDQSMFTVM